MVEGKGWLSVVQGEGGLCVRTRGEEEGLEQWLLIEGCADSKLLLLNDRIATT